jgi:uncharacterized protein YqgC (DUF456 family)
MAVVGLVLGALPVLNVVALAFLVLHVPVDAARRTVFAIVVEMTSELSLLALTVALVDVATGVATTPILVDVGA